MATVLTLLRAAGEATRLRILAALSTGELTVSELVQVLLQSQPRISRHLKLLTDSGLVYRHPEGSWVFYRLNESALHGDFVATLLARLPDDDTALQRDRERLAQVRRARADRAQDYFAANAENWDAIRALHIPEKRIEQEMRRLAGDARCELLVDLGTGTGRMLEVFADRARRAVGFDVSPDMLTIARVRLDDMKARCFQVRQGDIHDVALEDGVADIVILHHVLHFLDNPQRAVAEAARILAAGGRLLIADFLPHDLEFLRADHAHRRLGFDDDEITHWLAQAGLTAGKPVHLHPDKGRGELTVALHAAAKKRARA